MNEDSKLKRQLVKLDTAQDLREFDACSLTQQVIQLKCLQKAAAARNRVLTAAGLMLAIAIGTAVAWQSRDKHQSIVNNEPSKSNSPMTDNFARNDIQQMSSEQLQTRVDSLNREIASLNEMQELRMDLMESQRSLQIARSKIQFAQFDSYRKKASRNFLDYSETINIQF